MNKELLYLAIGDSLTAGYGAVPKFSFVSRYRAMTEQTLGQKVRLENTGKIGATTGDLLDTIRNDSGIRSLLAQADIISLTAGGNDLIQAAKQFYNDKDTRYLKTALKRYYHNMGRIVSEMKRLKHGKDRPYIIRLVGLYNPLPEFEEAILWVNRFNARLRGFEQEPIRVVELYDAFLGCEDALLSEDRIHPNVCGYLVMAMLTHWTGYGPLS